MIYAEIKNSQEQERLEAALEAAKEKKWYRRVLVITLSTQQYTVSTLSEMLGLCQATIRSDIHAYNAEGLAGLQPGKSPGCPPKLAHWPKADWDQVLEQTPNQYEKLLTPSRQWPLALLGQYLKEYHQQDVCISTVYHSLRRTGRRTGRSKLRVGSPDPDYVVTRQAAEAGRNLPAGGS